MAEWRGMTDQEFEARYRKAAAQGLTATAVEAQNTVVSQFLSGDPLDVQTGSLRRSIAFEVDELTLEAKIGPLANSPAKKYAAIHEFGGVIKPKTAKALRFKIGEKWITAAKVVIPARPYLRPGVRRGAAKLADNVRNAFAREFR